MQLCCRLNTQRRKNDEHHNVPHKALNADSDAHPLLRDDGVSITKCISEHIMTISMLIVFSKKITHTTCLKSIDFA